MHKQLSVVALAASVAVSAFAHDEPQKPRPPASHDRSSKAHEHSGGKETAFGRQDERHMAQAATGKTGVIVWQFTRAGEFYYASLVEDHFELGMYGKIRVR